MDDELKNTPDLPAEDAPVQETPAQAAPAQGKPKEENKLKKTFSRFFKKADEEENKDAGNGRKEKETDQKALAVKEPQTSIAKRNRAIPGAPTSRTLDASQNDSSAGALPSFFKRRTKRPNFIISVLLTTLTMYLVVAIVAVSAGAGAVMGIAKAYTETTKNLDVSVIMDLDQTSFIYDAYGRAQIGRASCRERV